MRPRTPAHFTSGSYFIPEHRSRHALAPIPPPLPNDEDSLRSLETLWVGPPAFSRDDIVRRRDADGFTSLHHCAVLGFHHLIRYILARVDEKDMKEVLEMRVDGGRYRDDAIP